MGIRTAKPTGMSESVPERTPAHAITTMDGVIGQEGAKRLLAGAMASGRVHHAWVFHGPAGVGKFTAGVAFAATLLDPTTSVGADGRVRVDGQSRVQALVRSGNHPDLHVITKELAAMSELQQVRDGKQITLATQVIREFLIAPALKTRVLAAEGGTPPRADKVFIVDEAELMNAQAQNALLKLLEEPPAGTVIILITPSEERLLPTIRSRCQRVAFTALDEGEMQQWVKNCGTAPGGGEVGVPTAQRAWLMRFAAGSPGLARLVIEHNLFAWNEELGPMLAHAAQGRFVLELGPAMVRLIGERAEAAVKANPDASKDAANKAWSRRMLAYVAEETRERLRAAAAGGDAHTLREDPATLRLLHTLDRISEAEQNLFSNVSVGFVFENLAAQMVAEGAGV